MKTTRPFLIGMIRSHPDTATGAPASGTAPLYELEPETPGRRPALRHAISLVVAVLSCARMIMCVASLSVTCLGQTRSAGDVRASEVKALEMKSVPDGHFLVNLQGDGRDRLVNVEVKDNVAKCVNSNDAQLKGLQGKFQLIGNGVFLIFFQNENHRASQYWLFRQDGSAAVKEVPDRGEKQTAVPAKDDSLEVPKKGW
jgi:flagellar basal body-associated protein FliL